MKKLQRYEDQFEFNEGVSPEIIANAEKMLDITFPDDYKKFLLQVASCNYGNTFILGIYENNGKIDYPVVDVTKIYREKVGLDKKFLVLAEEDMEFLILYNVEDKKIYDAEIGHEGVDMPVINTIYKDECNTFDEYFDEFILLGEE